MKAAEEGDGDAGVAVGGGGGAEDAGRSMPRAWMEPARPAKAPGEEHDLESWRDWTGMCRRVWRRWG